MSRPTQVRSAGGKRSIRPNSRFAPHLLPLEDRSVPATIFVSQAQFATAVVGDVNEAFTGVGALTGTNGAGLTFVDLTNAAAAGGAAPNGTFAARDVTAAFNIARDTPGPDTIFLDDETFLLDNSEGKSALLSGGFNDNTYWFQTGDLTIRGSGLVASAIKSKVSTFSGNPADFSQFDAVFAVRGGAKFTGSDFHLDGAGQKIGVGITLAPGSLGGTLTNVGAINFVALDGTEAGQNGTAEGVGLNVDEAGGKFVSVTGGLFSGNGRAGVSFQKATGEVLGSTFVGGGLANSFQYGLQVLGESSVYASGNSFDDFDGVTGGGTQSAALVASQAFDLGNPALLLGGSNLLAVGNVVTKSQIGIAAGSPVNPGADTSVVQAHFNNLAGAVVALDATQALSGPLVQTGVTAGIDGRFNFFGGAGATGKTVGPARLANTGSYGDERLNPFGIGSPAVGNARISNFVSVALGKQAVPVPGGFTGDITAARQAILPTYAPAAPATNLVIYVNGPTQAFTDNGAGKNAQAFTGSGALPAQAAGALQFVETGTPYFALGFAGGSTNSIAVPDITTALDLARDNALLGATTKIYLGTSDVPFELNNSNGASLLLNPADGFNDDTYFLNTAAVSILGSGAAASKIVPQDDTYAPQIDPGTEADAVIAIRQGATFTGNGFSLDGGAADIGIGLTVAPTAGVVTLTKVAVNNFAAYEGTDPGKAGSGFGFGVNVDGSAKMVMIDGSTFAKNERAGVNFQAGADGSVLNSTFTGSGAGNRVQYGIQVQGGASVYASGNTATGFLGVAGDGSQSAAIVVAQQADGKGGVLAGGAQLLAVGNVLTGNQLGVAVGSKLAGGTDPSVALVHFNDLSGNLAAGVDATLSNSAAGTVNAVDGGVDARFNFWGGGGTGKTVGPARMMDTAAFDDDQTNPDGLGSMALGNTRISNFVGVPLAANGQPNAAFAGNPADLVAARAAVLGVYAPAAPASNLIIYVNGTNGGASNVFTNDGAGKNKQAFQAGAGQPSKAAGTLQFVETGTPFFALGFAAGSTNAVAVPDITTAYDLARDNAAAGATTKIFLGVSDTAYGLQNANGASALLNGGFNDNSYFFTGTTLSVIGAGLPNSLVMPLTSTYQPANPTVGGALSVDDAVMAVRNGGTFTGTGFTYDGSAADFGIGLTVTGGSTATLDKVGVRNFVAEDGAGKGGSARGIGVSLLPNANGGASAVVSNSQFSGNGRIGVSVVGNELGTSKANIVNTSFTGRGVGDRVDYGVNVIGAGLAYVSGSTFTAYQGKASGDGTQSAGIQVDQGVTDANALVPFAGGGKLVAVGNDFTGNRIGVAVANATAAGTSTADVRFNNFAGNAVGLSAANIGATAKITAPNNFFGPLTATPAAPPAVDGAGSIVGLGQYRTAPAPVIDIASPFAKTTDAVTTDAATAALAYVNDARVQSPVVVSGVSPAAGKDLVVTIAYAEALAPAQSGTGFLFDPTLVTVQLTNNKGVTSTLAIAPVLAADGKSATVTVPAATLGASNGSVTVLVAASRTTYADVTAAAPPVSNPQVTASGEQTGAGNTTVTFGTLNSGFTVTASPASLAVTPGVAKTTTLTVNGLAAGRTLTVGAPVVGDSKVVVTRVAGSPDTAPQYTVTSASGPVGGTSFSVTFTDSDGITQTAVVPVQYGVANSGLTIGAINDLTFAVNGPAQTVGTTVAANSPGRTVTAVTAVASPTNLFTVTTGGTLTNPTFTVTPIGNAVGSGVVTVTATDSDGVTASRAFLVQVGQNQGQAQAPTITGTGTAGALLDQTIPFGGSTSQTFTIAGTNRPLAVAAVSSNPNVQVTVSPDGDTRTVTVRGGPNASALNGETAAITVTVTDSAGVTNVRTFNARVAPAKVRRFAVGSGVGETGSVQVYDANGVKLFGFVPFELSFTGGVTVATGDVNGDGVDDIVTGASVGGGPRVRVFNGRDGVVIADFFAFEGATRTGVNVAVGKVLDTGTSAEGFFRDQIVVGSGEGGGPRVSVFDVVGGKESVVSNFFAYESTFRNGVTVAAGDLDGDGLAEVVTGAGVGGAPRVRSFNARTGAAGALDFNAFDGNFRGGVSVAAGDLTGTGRASVVAGVGPNGGSLVRVFSSAGTQTSQFQAYPDAGTVNKAVRVGTAAFGTAAGESILTGPGLGGGPRVQVYSGTNPAAGPAFTDFAFADRNDSGVFFRGGIFVG